MITIIRIIIFESCSLPKEISEKQGEKCPLFAKPAARKCESNDDDYKDYNLGVLAVRIDYDRR